MTLSEYTGVLEKMFEENPRGVFMMTNEKLKIFAFEIVRDVFIATVNDFKIEYPELNKLNLLD